MSARPIVPKPPMCAPYGSSEYYEWPYLPSLAPGVAFTVIFGLIMLTQAFYMFRYRAWWMFFLVAGALLEFLGWIGRLVSHYCPYSDTLNTMQISTLIMGPAWTQASVYIAFWIVVQLTGSHYSPVPSKLYLWICVIVDTICLTLQAIGGGLAGAASSNYGDPQTGTTIMVVGIIAQLCCGVIFFVFLCLVTWRGRREIKQNRRVTLCVSAIAFSTTMMNLRGFYRSVELVQGWTGYLIVRERYVIGLDAIPMVLAMSVLAILSPGPLLVKQRRAQLQLQQQQQQAKEQLSQDKEAELVESDGSENTLNGYEAVDSVPKAV